MTRPSALLALAASLTLAACDQDVTPTDTASPSSGVAFATKPINTGGSAVIALRMMNARLAARHAKFRIDHVEWVTRGDQQQIGQEVFANDRGNKHTGIHFVAGDPRRGHGNVITYLVDQSDGATHTGVGLTNAQTEAAIDREMHTWDVTTTCSKFPIVKVPDTGADPDVVDGLLGFGDIGTPFADITHAGWMPGPVFDLFAPGGSTFILGITFTFFFTEADGTPTDINHDGELDTAFHETYYNDAFPWGINTDNTAAIDVETVALHESGHGLDQNHFGKIFATLSNGRLHFAPQAVMNAAISIQKHSLLGSDMAGHCSLWGSWPNR